MALPIDDLLSRIRSELDDPQNDDYPEDQLWSEEDITEYLEDAQSEFCRITEIFRESESATDGLTNIDFAAGEYSKPLHPSIIRILEASIPGIRRGLTVRDMQYIKRQYPNWHIRNGTPNHYVLDYQPETIFIHPITQVDITLELHVVRRAVKPFSKTNKALELPSRYWPKLINWVKHRAYSKHDTETLDLQKAKIYGDLFVMDGETAMEEIRKRRYVPRITHYAG